MLSAYNQDVVARWDVEYTDEFEVWWNALDAEAQEDIDVVVHLLEAVSPALTRPYADTAKGGPLSEHARTARTKPGRPIRILYVFDPRRTAILLIGGDKTGLTDERFYGTFIPIAERLYGEHLETIKQEEERHG